MLLSTALATASQGIFYFLRRGILGSYKARANLAFLRGEYPMKCKVLIRLPLL
jgi:hypothetical protein